jgi:hypothetical protein
MPALRQTEVNSVTVRVIDMTSAPIALLTVKIILERSVVDNTLRLANTCIAVQKGLLKRRSAAHLKCAILLAVWV